MKNQVLTTINLLLAIVLIYGISGINSSATAAQGQIKACSDKNTGVLRVASKCKSTERRISWNIRGPQGLPGDSATLNTKWVGLSYIGNPAVALPCGTAGSPIATWSNYKVFSGFWINGDTLTSSSYWHGLTLCYITFKVIAD